MEVAVDAVTARLRGGFAETLLDWRDAHSEDQDGGIHRAKQRLFAPLPSRKRPLTTSGDDVDWRAVLLTVFRRFAGELLVEGKLLNHDEIEVCRFARTRRSSQVHPVVVSLRENGSVVVGRFIVRCRDAPTSAVGSMVTALVMKQHARSLGGLISSSVPIASYRSDVFVSLCGADPSEAAIVSMTSVFGFDVAQFVGPTSQRRGNADRYASDDDGDDDAADVRCANAAIIKHSTFSDLRGVRRLMDAYHLPPMQSTSLLASPHKPSHATDTIMGSKDHAWSFVSLGTAQKTLWAQERVTRGDSFRAKGRLKECLIEYDSALHLDDRHGDALLRRGQVYIELRQYEDAIRDLEKLCELEPTNEAAIKALLRAKGKLGHSKHVVTASFGQRSRSASRDTKPKSPRRDQSDPLDGRMTTEPTMDETLTAVEKDRLRKLLEEDAKARKQSRYKSSRHRRSKRSLSSSSSDDDDSESSNSEADSRHKRRKRSKHKKSKKSKKSSSSRDRKKRSKKTSRRRREDESQSDGSGTRDSRRHKRSRRSRSRSRSRSSRPQSSRSASVVTEDMTALHPILARKPHRLWN